MNKNTVLLGLTFALLLSALGLSIRSTIIASNERHAAIKSAIEQDQKTFSFVTEIFSDVKIEFNDKFYLRNFVHITYNGELICTVERNDSLTLSDSDKEYILYLCYVATKY